MAERRHGSCAYINTCVLMTSRTMHARVLNVASCKNTELQVGSAGLEVGVWRAGVDCQRPMSGTRTQC